MRTRARGALLVLATAACLSGCGVDPRAGAGLVMVGGLVLFAVAMGQALRIRRLGDDLEIANLERASAQSSAAQWERTARFLQGAREEFRVTLRARTEERDLARARIADLEQRKPSALLVVAAAEHGAKKCPAAPHDHCPDCRDCGGAGEAFAVSMDPSGVTPGYRLGACACLGRGKAGAP